MDKMSAELGLRIYTFSVWHIFFEQYLTIAKDSLHILGGHLSFSEPLHPFD